MKEGGSINHQLEKFVALYFSDIPYSEKAVTAQDQILSALKDEYEKACAQTGAADRAFEIIVGRYAKLSDMAALVGYGEADVAEWRSLGGAMTPGETRSQFAAQRRYAGVIAFALTSLAVNLFEGILLHWANLISAALWAAIAYAALRLYRKHDSAAGGLKYNRESYKLLCGLSDRYTKRTLNGIFILFATIPLFATILLSVQLGSLKNGEILTLVQSNLILVEVPLFLCVRNLLCLSAVKHRLHTARDQTLRKHILGAGTFALIYWLLATAATVGLRSTLKNPLNLYTAAFLLYLALVAIYNLNTRKKVTFQNIVINRKRIALAASVALLFSGYQYIQKDTWYTQPYINAVSRIETADNTIAYDGQTGVYTITAANDTFKILQLTDIHLGGSLFSYTKDIKALEACYALIRHTSPDLVIVTGDLTFPMGLFSLSLNNVAPVNQFAAFMRNVGIPWAFTYGNHDTESVATHSRTELDEVYKSLSYQTSGTLLYPYVQPDITGRNNQVIEIRNADGSLNQALFLLDSNDYTGEGINVYDYIHDDQVEWYAGELRRLNAQEGKTVSSMVFFHIPLQQYRTAYELYTQGSDEVEYFFGENNEKMIDKVCCSDYPSKLFDTMVELGSTKAAFCGHDHYNNMSLGYRGIRLTYGMSIDYLAMPGIENDTAQRGATLITLHADSGFEIAQVPLASLGEKNGGLRQGHGSYQQEAQ